MISPVTTITAAILFSTAAGMPLLTGQPTAGRQRISVLLHLFAAIAGIHSAITTLLSGTDERWLIQWNLPLGPAEIGIDPLSAFFLIPVCLVTACCAVYSLNYYPAESHTATAPRLSFFCSVLTTSMFFILVARHAVVFLVGWEIMSIACYFAMTIDGRKKEVREAGILYLVTAHLGALALIALFAVLKGTCGSYSLPATASLQGTGPLSGVIFLTAFFAFGMKAGIIPLHIWLPSAHGNAPSHISAVMSGVLIKIGIYGMIRSCSLFTAIPFWWGGLILVAGIVSGIAGVVFAIGQHDIKRLLAYHSIENIGIICIGLGLAMLGASRGMPVLILLGLSGALLHTLNHALFKSLLFFGAGSVIHACGTQEIDKLGGLIKKMPLTALYFLTGAVAICGLPPLNGFISEWLIYLGLLRGLLDTDTLNDPFCALAAPALALIGALAVACFVKVFGIVFLGAPRSENPAQAHEAGSFMLAPMGFLAAACVITGMAPFIVSPLLESVCTSLYPSIQKNGIKIAAHAPLGMLSIASLILLLVIIAAGLIYLQRLKKLPLTTAETWGCGYLAPTARMQYSSSSFAATLVTLFSGILRPHGKTPSVKGFFPQSSSFRSHVPEALLEGVYLPLFNGVNSRLSLLRKLQHGKLHLYILYIVITLIALLAWSHFRMRGAG